MVASKERHRNSRKFRILAKIAILVIFLPLFAVVVYSDLPLLAYVIALFSITVAVMALAKVVDRIGKKPQH